MRKIHLGCGDIHLDGYINIDYHKSPAVDMEWNLETPFDSNAFDDNTIDEILGYHIFEHLAFNGIEQVLKSWWNVLKPDGRLILEMPDFDETAKNYMKTPNDITVIASIFGCQEHEGQFHKWGWNKTRLKFALQATGFKQIEFEEPTDYHAQLEPSLRVVATK